MKERNGMEIQGESRRERKVGEGRREMSGEKKRKYEIPLQNPA